LNHERGSTKRTMRHSSWTLFLIPLSLVVLCLCFPATRKTQGAEPEGVESVSASPGGEVRDEADLMVIVPDSARASEAPWFQSPTGKT